MLENKAVRRPRRKHANVALRHESVARVFWNLLAGVVKLAFKLNDMFRSLTLAALACGFLLTASAQSTEFIEMAIGDKAPLTDFKMTNIDGQDWSLVDIAGDGGTLVIFTCNTCPFVVGREGKMKAEPPQRRDWVCP